MYSPEEIMAELFCRRRLERSYRYPLGIQVAEYIPDHSVFSAGVHTLDHDQQGMFAFGIKQVLQFIQLSNDLLCFLFDLFFVELLRSPCGDLFQPAHGLFF